MLGATPAVPNLSQNAGDVHVAVFDDYADAVMAATHSTAPWYFILVPIALIGARFFFRRGGGRGPFGGRGGPFGGGRGTGSSGPDNF